MKKENWITVLISSLFIGANLQLPLYCMVGEYIDGHKMGALIMGIIFTFMIGTFFGILQLRGDEMKEKINELKKKIEDLENNGKE